MFKRNVWVYISGYFMFVVEDNFEMNTKVKQMKNICILNKNTQTQWLPLNTITDNVIRSDAIISLSSFSRSQFLKLPFFRKKQFG